MNLNEITTHGGFAATDEPDGFFYCQKMGKDPAFLFYSKDFLTGVSDLTFEERGQYITLLAIQHQKGTLTKKVIDITVPNVSDDVIAKFVVDKDGNYYNERLRLEAKKRKDHSEKQKERAIKGWEKRKSQTDATALTTADATALPLVNGDVNEDVNTNSLNKVYFQNSELNDVFERWLKMLDERQKPMTRSSIEALQMKLNRQSAEYSIKQIEQSLEKNWLNLRPIEITDAKEETKEEEEARIFMQSIKDYNTHKTLYGEESANEKFKFTDNVQPDQHNNRLT